VTRRILVGIVLVAVAAVLATAQERSAAEQPKGSVSGRVMRDGKPAPGVGVMVSRGDSPANLLPVGQTVTGPDGAFRLESLAAGRYIFTVDAPRLVLDGIQLRWWGNGRQLTLANGEAVEGFDLALVRGGVITGRVTNVDGKPVTGEQIVLQRIGEGGSKQLARAAGRNATDDRGIYRLYGLAAGRYIVAAGTPDDPRMLSFGQAKRYRVTYHPAAAVDSEATVVDVAAGGEVSGVDIVLPKAERLFEASGRVVYGDTGTPGSGLGVGYGIVTANRFAGAYGSVGRTSETGTFRLTGLKPGDYGLMVQLEPGNPYFGKPLGFTIENKNVDGLVLVLERGLSVSGQLVIEGARPADSPGANGLTLTLERTDPPAPGAIASVGYPGAKVGADGAFTITGVEPGRHRFILGPWNVRSRPSIVRVERDGVPAAGEIEVRAGDPATVRIVAAYGSATIQGRAMVKGGVAASQSAAVTIQRTDVAAAPRRYPVDGRLRFVADNLPAGRYSVKLTVYQLDAGQTRRFESDEKIVEVGEGQIRDLDLDVEVTDAE
jgi:hypothetical protein